MRTHRLLVLALLPLVVTASVSAADRSYLVMGKVGAAPARVAADVVKAAGVVERTIPEVGIVVARSANPGFAAKAAGLASVQSVVPNLRLNWLPPTTAVAASTYGNPPTSGDDDFFFDLQWGHDAVDAPEAWNAGYRGAGVRVAVLDSGIDCTQPDIAPNLNAGLSTSFVPGEGVCVQPGLYFNHGTHVAGTIAAPDNDYGTIGVAPEAEIVAVKVLSEYTGSGAFDWIIAGIVYAAKSGADVINMSLGGYLKKGGFWDDNGTPEPEDDVFVTAREVAELNNAIGRATTYAYQKGSTVIAAAGNSGLDFDHTSSVVFVPASAPHVIAVAATAPLGWAVDSSVYLDNPASYTNFGQSAIDFAAPGGDFQYLFVDPEALCTVGVVAGYPCWLFDLVLGPCPGDYFWAAGTSMAAPHVSGVAAIIIGRNGGTMPPAQVEAALRKAADDLGKPGNDDFYGAGRVNAANAVQ